MNWTQLLSPTRIGRKTIEKKQERNAFEADYDRIIFSYPFRRLQNKTQVFPFPDQDFVHNRLTHSLEVSSVARSLGKKTGEKIIEKYNLNDITANDIATIVSAAALAHDVGNPPFGHSGEEAISIFFKNNKSIEWLKKNCSNEEWRDLENFEGNAQGFRLINQKEQGLSLTFATLGAFTKYPKGISSLKDRKGASQKKYGFFQTEKKIFNQISTTLGLSIENKKSCIRHPLAFLVEAADDICYHIIDLEDACALKLITLAETIALLKPIVGENFKEKELEKKKKLHEKLGILRALAINELIKQTVDVFLKHEKEMLIGKFDTPLIHLTSSAVYLKKIINTSIQKIYKSKIVVEKEIVGYEALNGLLEIFIGSLQGHLKGVPTAYHKLIFLTLPSSIRQEIHKSTPVYTAIRVILDYISGMTDKHALTFFRKLKVMNFSLV